MIDPKLCGSGKSGRKSQSVHPSIGCSLYSTLKDSRSEMVLLLLFTKELNQKASPIITGCE